MMSALPFSVDPVLSHALGATLSVVLISGAWQKLWEHEEFAATLENYRLLPASLVNGMAWLLPLVEGMAGVMLLFAATRPPAAWLALALLLLVTAAVTINLARGDADIECGCGGLAGAIGEQRISWGLVARNLVVMAAIPWIAADSATRDLVWVDYLTVAAATLALLFLYALVSQLLATQPRLVALRSQ